MRTKQDKSFQSKLGSTLRFTLMKYQQTLARNLREIRKISKPSTLHNNKLKKSLKY